MHVDDLRMSFSNRKRDENVQFRYLYCITISCTTTVRVRVVCTRFNLIYPPHHVQYDSVLSCRNNN